MSNKNMFLYWGSGSSPCWKAMIVLAEKGLWEGVPNKLLEWSKMEHKSEEVLKLNPRGQLPTFRDGDVVVNESSAICLYLEDKYSNDSNRLMPTDPGERAAVYQKIFEWSNYFDNVMSILDYKYDVPVMAWDPYSSYADSVMSIIDFKFRNPIMAWDPKYVKECYIKANRELQFWENHLKGKKYLVGDKFSMADVIFFPSLATTIRMGACLEKRYPALQAYYLRLKERPSVKTTWPPHWSEGPSHGMMHGLCDGCY